MADNIDITPGTGATVATDDCGAAGHTQIVKLAISTNGSATLLPGDATNGIDVDVTRLPGTVTEDAVSAGGESLLLVGAVRNDAAASKTSNDGDYSGISVDAAGRVGIADLGGAISVDDNGSTLSVDDGGSSLTVDGTVTANLAAGTNNIGDVDVLTVPAPLSTAGNGTAATALRVTIASDTTGVVGLAAGTNAIGKLAANSGVDIGDVDVTSLTGGTIAHDAADSGNPIKVGARAAATLADDTMVANADRVDLVADLDAALIVRPGFPLGDLISERVTNTDGASTALTNFGAGGAGVRNFITCIVVYNSSATAGTIDFRDGTGGSVLFTVPIPAGGGCVIANGGMPLFKTSANTALAFDVSAALSTVTISLSGFRSKVV